MSAGAFNHTSQHRAPSPPPPDQPRRSWMELLWGAAQNDPNLPPSTRLVARWICLHIDGLGANEFRVSQRHVAAQMAKQLGRVMNHGELRRHLYRLEGDAKIGHGWRLPPERGPIRSYLVRQLVGGGSVKGGNGKASIYVLGPDAVGSLRDSLSLGVSETPRGAVETVDGDSPREESRRLLTTAARSVRLRSLGDSPVLGVKTPRTTEGVSRQGGRARPGALPAHTRDARARATPPAALPPDDTARPPGGGPRPASGAEIPRTPVEDPLAGGAPHAGADASAALPGPDAQPVRHQGGELRKIFAEGRAVIAAAEERRPDLFPAVVRRAP